MNRAKNQMVTFMVFLGIGPIGLCAKPFAKGPYLGQTPPGSTAQVFAPGLICHTEPRRWEANGTFSADWKSACKRDPPRRRIWAHLRRSIRRCLMPSRGSFLG